MSRYTLKVGYTPDDIQNVIRIYDNWNKVFVDNKLRPLPDVVLVKGNTDDYTKPEIYVWYKPFIESVNIECDAYAKELQTVIGV